MNWWRAIAAFYLTLTAVSAAIGFIIVSNELPAWAFQAVVLSIIFAGCVAFMAGAQ